MIDILIALFVAFVWGASFTAIELGLRDFPPMLFASLRFALVAVFALLFLPKPSGSYGRIAAFGILTGLLQFGLLFFAMDGHADAGTSALLIQAQVPLTMLLAVLLLREHVTRRQWFGVAVSALGLAMVFLGQSGRIDQLGLLLTLLAALSFAGGNLVMRRAGGVEAFHMVAWSCLLPPLPLLAISLATEGTNPVSAVLGAGLTAWLSLAFVAAFATLLGFGLWGRLLATYSTGHVLPFAMCIPVFAQSVASIALDEPFGIEEGVVTVIVIAGALLCQKRLIMRQCVPVQLLENGAHHVDPATAAKCRSGL
ncbi:MAG: EamA family transporter [Woeseiaceae bacterium]